MAAYPILQRFQRQDQWFTDVTTGLNYGMDLTPLIAEPQRDPQAYVQEHIQRFSQDVAGRLARLS